MLPWAEAIGEGGLPHAPSLNATCDHCGSVIGAAARLESDGLTLFPRQCRAVWRDQEVRLRPAGARIVETLMAAGGALISPCALLSRAGYRGDNPEKRLRVHLCHIRKALPGVPIHCEPGLGYAWRPDIKEQSV